MTKTPIEELLKQCPSIYKLVVAAAKRAKELAEGAPKLVDGDFKKITTVALEEIRQGKIVCYVEGAEAVVREAKPKKRAPAMQRSRKS